MKTKTLCVLGLLTLIAACGDKAPDQPVVDTTEPDPAPAALERSASATGASVFFISPADGETVSNPIKVVFGIAGMDVVAAGNDAPHSGHHHLLIDTGPPNLGFPIPKDDHHVHFGDGSTETEITLESGPHTLQMLLGDHLHIPHDPPLMSDPITVHVE